MINRSGFVRAVLALTSASLFALFAACGGKVDGGTTSSPDGGVQGGDAGCAGTISCPSCPGAFYSSEPVCIDGQWNCSSTECPPPTCGDIAPDCKCGTASCVNDEWVCPSDCTDACPPDITGLAGTACSVEGLICGGEDCDNPCDFCNFIGCTGGVWTDEESPPEPCPIDGGSFDGG